MLHGMPSSATIALSVRRYAAAHSCSTKCTPGSRSAVASLVLSTTQIHDAIAQLRIDPVRRRSTLAAVHQPRLALLGDSPSESSQLTNRDPADRRCLPQRQLLCVDSPHRIPSLPLSLA